MLGKRKELFEKLNQVIDQATNKCFYFVTKPSNQMKHMDFSHDKDGVWEEFCRGQISYFKQIDNDSDFELVDLISADERKKAIYVLDDYVNEFSNLVEIIRNVEKLLDNYANKEFDDLKLMVTRFDTLEKTNSLLTFKIIYPVQTIYKKNSISWNKGYKKNKNNLFRIPQNFEFFIYENKLYIIDIDRFEKLYMEELEAFRIREARSTLKFIKENNFLSEKTCTQLETYLFNNVKLVKQFLKAKDRLRSASKTVNEIHVVNYLKDGFSGYDLVNEYNEIEIDSIRKAKSFIKILGDEIFVSRLTGNTYNVKASNLVQNS